MESSFSDFSSFPFELIEMIFDLLDLGDVLTFRRVSKKFKDIVNEFKVKGLVFVDNPEFEKSFQFLNRPINFRHLIISKANLSFLGGSSLNLQRLRRLKVCSTANNYAVSLEHVNRLTQLEYLELNLILFTKPGDPKRIALPELRTLVIRISQNVLEFETPKLLQLDIEGSHKSVFVFRHSLSVEHLKTDRYKEQFAVLKNLRMLDCHGSFNDSGLDETILSTYPNLQLLSVESCGNLYNLNSIMKRRRILRRLDLRVYYRGVELECNHELSYNDLVYQDALTYQIENYGRLKKSLSWIKEINYGDLMSLVNDRIPSNFFAHFNNIQRLRVTRLVQDEKHLLRFISNCKNLNRLIIDHCYLRQSFYERLCRISSLVSLEIFETDQVNLEFLRRLPYLKSLKTNQQLDRDGVRQALKRLKYLESMEFKMGTTNIRIDRYAGDSYSLTNSSRKSDTYHYNKLPKLIASLDRISAAEKSVLTRSQTRNKFK